MILQSVADIDFKRFQAVREGRLIGRGCGKTVTKMLLMIRAGVVATTQTAKNSSFLYVGENHTHVKDIQRNVEQLLHEVGFDVGISPSKRTSINQKIGTYGNEIRSELEGIYVNFRFIHADEFMPQRIRGYRFNEIFVDVTHYRYYEFYREMGELPLYKI